MINDEGQDAPAYSVSICPGGHATIRLGKAALFLQIQELRSLIQTAQQVLQEYEDLDSGHHGHWHH